VLYKLQAKEGRRATQRHERGIPDKSGKDTVSLIKGCDNTADGSAGKSRAGDS
jgi:hypothetical protein